MDCTLKAAIGILAEIAGNACKCLNAIAPNAERKFCIRENAEFIAVVYEITTDLKLQKIKVEGKGRLEINVVQSLSHGILKLSEIRANVDAQRMFFGEPFGGSQLKLKVRFLVGVIVIEQIKLRRYRKIQVSIRCARYCTVGR